MVLRAGAVIVSIVAAALVTPTTHAKNVWPAETLPDGYYRVQSVMQANSCVDIGFENISKNEENIHRDRCSPDVSQEWSIHKDADGSGRYVIEWSSTADKVWSAANLSDKGEYLKFMRDQASKSPAMAVRACLRERLQDHQRRIRALPRLQSHPQPNREK